MKPEMRVVTSATLVESQTKGNNTPKEGNLIKPTNTKQPEIGTKKPEDSSIKKSEEIKSIPTETPSSKISNVNITTSKLQSQSNISSKEEPKLKSSENEMKELKLPKEESNKNMNKDPKKEIPKSAPADKISTTIPTTQKPASTPKPPVPPPPPPMNNDFSSKKMVRLFFILVALKINFSFFFKIISFNLKISIFSLKGLILRFILNV